MIGFLRVALIISLLFPLNSYASCASKDEITAIRMKALQTELMFAALSCGQNEEYNKFVTKYQSDLSRNGVQLKKYFSKVAPGREKSRLNKFTTQLANEASDRSLTMDISKFCNNAYSVFKKSYGQSAEKVASLGKDLEYPSLKKVKECTS